MYVCMFPYHFCRLSSSGKVIDVDTTMLNEISLNTKVWESVARN